MNDAYLAYCNGDYSQTIQLLLQSPPPTPSPQWDMLLANTYLKMNHTEAAIERLRGMLLTAIYDASSQEIGKEYQQVLSGLDTLARLSMIDAQFTKLALSGQRFASRIQVKVEKEDVLVFPALWPVAFGDIIVFLQLIKKYEEDSGKKAIVIMPLNRPELKSLADLSGFIVFDVTRLPEESNRLKTIRLIDPELKVFNLAIQECMIREILEMLSKQVNSMTIIKLRYLPILRGVSVTVGSRLWETRAKLWLAGEELPKLVAQKEKKKKKITLHFREADYADPSRDINPNYQLDLVKSIKDKYPEYELVKLGDKNMTTIPGTTAAHNQDLNLTEQIKHIQESRLFIGSHSAVKDLAAACSDTPIIVLQQALQETATHNDQNIAALSYQCLSKQLVKTFFVRQFDALNQPLLPTQMNTKRVRFEPEPIENVMEAMGSVLG